MLFKVLALLTGGAALFAGMLATFLLRYLPPASPLFWFLPVVLLVAASWLLLRLAGIVPLMVIFVTAFLASNWSVSRYWMPDHSAAPEVSAEDGLVSVTVEVPEPYRIGPFRAPRVLEAPAGTRVTVFASGLAGVRMLAVGPRGDLYASQPKEGRVLVLPDRDRDGVADSVEFFASGLDRPHGLAFLGGELFAAESGRLLRMSDRDDDLRADRIDVVSMEIPSGGGHWTRTVAAGPDGALYVSVGSSCNVCLDDPRRAAVLRIGLGGNLEVHASGLRNSVGLAFHPVTGDLWASDNGRDLLGDDLPPEEVNRIVAGGDYGWPFCYGQRIPDPEYGSGERCRDTLPPEVEMQAHSAPLGIVFGYGLAAPERYRDMLYVAFHGSWNRTVPTGYKLVGIPFRAGEPSGPPIDLVRGWLQAGTAWGRPVAPVIGADGALYLSDDRAGAIYRIELRDVLEDGAINQGEK